MGAAINNGVKLGTTRGNGGTGGAAIGSSGTGGEARVPPLVLVGHAYVDSPAIGAGGIGFGLKLYNFKLV